MSKQLDTLADLLIRDWIRDISEEGKSQVRKTLRAVYDMGKEQAPMRQCPRDNFDCFRDYCNRPERDGVPGCLEEVIEHARQEEREACVRVAEKTCTWVNADSYGSQVDMRARIAEGIRARGKP